MLLPITFMYYTCGLVDVTMTGDQDVVVAFVPTNSIRRRL